MIQAKKTFRSRTFSTATPGFVSYHNGGFFRCNPGTLGNVSG
jgi:hypothetical protein